MVVFINSINLCNGQKAQIILYKGDSISIYISRHTDFFIIAEDATYAMKDIKLLKFEVKNSRTEQLRQEIGSKIDIVYANELPLQTLVPTIEHDQNYINKSMVNTIENFRHQRTTGKTMQIVGILIVGASVGLQSVYNQKYNDAYAAYTKKGSGSAPIQQSVPSAVPFIGCGFSLIGFGIDLDAGRHLKLFGQ
jgi:regulatory protein YycH of two-component signal transduction system YycFG